MGMIVARLVASKAGLTLGNASEGEHIKRNLGVKVGRITKITAIMQSEKDMHEMSHNVYFATCM